LFSDIPYSSQVNQDIYFHFIFVFDMSHPTASTVTASNGLHIRRVWRYQRGNQNPWIEEQTMQWLKKTDKQQSKKQYIANRGELSYSGRVSSSFSTSDTSCATIVTNLVMNEERTGGMLGTCETYRWSLVTQIFRNG
jgi:hypothetical protein